MSANLHGWARVANLSICPPGSAPPLRGCEREPNGFEQDHTTTEWTRYVRIH